MSTLYLHFNRPKLKAENEEVEEKEKESLIDRVKGEKEHKKGGEEEEKKERKSI